MRFFANSSLMSSKIPNGLIFELFLVKIRTKTYCMFEPFCSCVLDVNAPLIPDKSLVA